VDLAQEWRNHRFSYNENSEVSGKSKHALGQKAKRGHRTAFDPSKIYSIE
jgi:hypothetical protein